MQQRRSSRFLAVGATAVVLLAGCTVGGSKSDAGHGGDGGGGTLVVEEWTNPPAVAFTKQLDAEFEKAHPGVKVRLQTAPTANNAWSTLLNTLLAAKSVDVMANYALGPTSFPPTDTGLKPSGVAALMSSGQLTDLSDQPFLKNYDPTAVKVDASYNGKTYGVPAAGYVNAGGLWYKPELLAKYHLSVPTTFSQFVAELKTLKSKGITPIFVAGKVGLQAIAYNGITQQLLMQNTPSDKSPELSVNRAKAFWDGTKKWTDPVYAKAAAEYQQVMQYVEPAAAGVSQLTAPGVWAAKADDYPFFLDGSWDGATIKEANPDLHYGFMSLPATDDASANRMAISGDLTWFVPSWAPHKKLALEWLAMFSQQATYQKWLAATGSVSTQPGVSSQKLPWMTWQNQHAAAAFPAVSGVWVPSGAATDAGGLDLTKLKPFGSRTIAQAQAASATAYRKARGK